MKVVENLFLKKKLMVKKSFIEKTNVVGTHWNSNVYLQHMLLKIRKKTIWKFTFSKYHVSFKHPKLPISIKIPVTTANCLYLHDSYSSKFEFMIYLLLTCKLHVCNYSEG